MAFLMGWEILWPLVLGFALSGIVQAVVTKGEMSRLLPDSSARTILIASGLGAASSSCSYVAIALARSLFRRGADFSAAMAFEFASTNLVLELGIILWVLMGWQFTLAEFHRWPGHDRASGVAVAASNDTSAPGTSPGTRRARDRRAHGRARRDGHVPLRRPYSPPRTPPAPFHPHP